MKPLARDPIAWLPLAAGLLAAVAGALRTSVPPRPPIEPDAGWTAPRWHADEASRAATAMRNRGLMGTQAPATPTAVPPSPGAASRELTPPDWRVVAVAIRGADRVAFLQIGTQQPAELRVGDALPGGAVIRRIESDRLLLSIDGKRRVLPLHGD